MSDKDSVGEVSTRAVLYNLSTHISTLNLGHEI